MINLLLFNRYCIIKNCFYHKCFKPYLLNNQIYSFNNFLKSINKSNYSIKYILKKYFPIINKKKTIFLKIKKIIIKNPLFSENYIINKNIHYYSKIYIYLNIFFIKKNNYVIKKFFLGNIPFMNKTGSFIINGTKKVLISQFIKSFGIYFLKEKNIKICKIIPFKGIWIELYFEKNNIFIFDKKIVFTISNFLFFLGINKNYFISFYFINIKLKIIKGKKKCFFLINKKNNLFKKIKKIFCIFKINNFYFKKNYFSLKNNILFIKYKNILNNINELFNSNFNFINIILFKNIISKKKVFFILNNFSFEIIDNKFGKLLNFSRKFFLKKNFNMSYIGLKRLIKKINIKNINIIFFLKILNKFFKFIKFDIEKDNFDSLENKIILNSGKLLSLKFEKCIKKLKKIIKYKIRNIKNINDDFQELIDSNIITIELKDYFCNNELSQFLDQNNPLSEISHCRKISLINSKNIKKENCGFDIRDIHYSYYCKICPVDTPEGHNIGLINSFSFFSKTNKYNFLTTVYKTSFFGKILGLTYIDYKIEKIKFISNNKSTLLTLYGEIYIFPIIEIRYKKNHYYKKYNFIDLIEISNDQLISIGASLIPFFENNDANRCLMGSNMQRQAIPLIKGEQPLIGTGNELIIGLNTGYNIISNINGYILYSDSQKIIVNKFNYIKIYFLKKYNKTNQNTCFHQRLKKNTGNIIKKGNILSDSFSTLNGEISLGINIKVAFMSWYGYNFEDSILLSKNILKKENFSSFHIYEFVTILKFSEFGYDITSNECFYEEQILKNGISKGIVNIGQKVFPKDILIGKMIPKNKKDFSPEEKLLKTIFSDNNYNYLNQSLSLPKNIKGTVLSIYDFKLFLINKKTIKILKYEQLKYTNKCLNNFFYELFFYYLIKIKKKLINKIIILNNKAIILKKININILLKIKCLNKKTNYKIYLLKKLIKKYYFLNKKMFNYKKDNFLKYEDFENNIIRIIKIKIIAKKKIRIGDKMSGRHGNKGVISNIIPEENMPYDKYGSKIDMILNPLGIPSRMNVGQLLECYLGLTLFNISNIIIKFYYKLNKFKFLIFLNLIFKNIFNKKVNFFKMNKFDLITFIKKIKNGINICTHNFNNIKENKILKFINVLGLYNYNKSYLYDGITGVKYKQLINIGIIYFMKLNHLVDDKIYSRSIGPYSLITQQPLGGKSNLGGQRLGEMEVWALEAYGASNLLKEMLTVKSDDVNGRIEVYKNIINGIFLVETGIPESFQVLLKEIKALCFDILVL